MNSKTTFQEILKHDLNICRKILNENKNYLHYNISTETWYIDNEEIVDLRWYNGDTILNPKELILYVYKIIEEEMGINKITKEGI